MGYGIEEGVAEAFTFAGSLDAGEGFDCAGSLDGDGGEATDGVEGFGRGSVAGDADGSDGTRAEQDGDQGYTSFLIAAMIAGEGGVAKLGCGDIHVVGAGTIDAVFFAEINCGSGEVEGGGDHLGKGVEQVDDVAGDEHLLAELVETLGLALAAAGDFGFAARASRQAGWQRCR